MTRKLVALFMALAMLFTCASALAGEPETKYYDSIFPLEEELTLTVFVKAMPGGVDYVNNYINQWVKEKTNINLEFTTVASGDDAKTKLTLMMSSGEKLPDILLSTGWTKAELLRYGSEGLVVPLNEYLENATVWNYLNEVAPLHAGDLTMGDGNIYSYGNMGECFHCNHQARMWIYQPWVDSLNDGKLPTTTDELYDFLVKVKTMDPNGNGKADEIPVTGYLDGWATDPFIFISNAFVQNNNFISNMNPTVAGGFMIEDGKVKFNLLTEEYRNALRYMNKLYSEGLLDAQTYTQNNEQCDATVKNEEHLVALMQGGVMPESDKMWVREPGDWQEWTLLPPLKGPDGVQLAYTGISTYFGSCNGVVTVDCEYPEIAVQLFDLMASEEGTNIQGYGIQGIQWDWTNEGVGLSGGTPKYYKMEYEHKLDDGNIDFAAYGYENIKSSTWDSDAGISGRTNVSREEEAVFVDPAMYSESILFNAAKVYNEYAAPTESIVPNMPYTESQSKKIADYTVSVGSYANSATIRFITGDLSIENDWDAYLAEMEKMDVKGYIAVMQEAYDAYTASLAK